MQSQVKTHIFVSFYSIKPFLVSLSFQHGMFPFLFVFGNRWYSCLNFGHLRSALKTWFCFPLFVTHFLCPFYAKHFLCPPLIPLTQVGSGFFICVGKKIVVSNWPHIFVSSFNGEYLLCPTPHTHCGCFHVCLAIFFCFQFFRHIFLFQLLDTLFCFHLRT